jgi:predicted flap endonuclease-1-like 5' DNA nuclease
VIENGMGLLQKLKSALGLDGAESASATGGSGDVDVTVERDPATESEDAVKGTDTAAESTDADEPVSTESESTDETAAEPPTGSPDDVTEIKGIGPAYADRLESVGIETIGELAVADAADIAAQTDLSESRVAGWIERANEY